MKLSFVYKLQLLLMVISLSTFDPVNAQHTMTHRHEQNVFLAMMDTMMIRMDVAVVDLSAEQDFIAQMIPHHQGAIEMAAYEIQFGKDFTMIQLAKSILAEQTSELQKMNLYKKQCHTDTSSTPKGFKAAMDKSMEIMMKNMPDNAGLINVDIAFASVMIPHHQAAVDMAKTVLKFSGDGQINAFAKEIISSEAIEIEQMLSFLNK